MHVAGTRRPAIIAYTRTGRSPPSLPEGVVAMSGLLLLLLLMLPSDAPRSTTPTGGTCLSAAVCEGGALCRPLSPQPVFEHEVVAYHSDGAYGSNGSEYVLYDYDKVTAIADYSWGYANETICTAHKHGVRVLGYNMYDMGPLHSEQFYANDTMMNAWIERAAQFTFDRGMDGIMLGENPSCCHPFSAVPCSPWAAACR